MVSPSKIQNQEHQQTSRENNSGRHSHIHVQKGVKPLERKSFYLDVKNHAIAAKLEAQIRYLGGAIELFLVRGVNLVVTDRIDKANPSNSEKRKWGSISRDSGGTPSRGNGGIPITTPTPLTPYFGSECPLSNSTNLQGQTAQRSKSRVDAMLERALTQPQQCSVDPLDNAQSWGIPIWATDKLRVWLDKIYASFKDTNSLKRLKQASQQDLKVKHLKDPYIKFESFHRGTRPVFLELSAWPTLNFDGDPGSCPFETIKREPLESRTVKREVKENKATESLNKEHNREMTRRPRTTANRARRTEQIIAGNCEICRIDYRDLAKHVQSDQHLSFVRNDDNFLSLDTLINAGASVEAFLKLNRSKNIGKECNLYSNGDHSLHNAVLSEEKEDKEAKSLNNFDVQQIKMVQCNGARRNLNLKLSSPHNLRARAKHESGHLLRSKGSPWHEMDKSEKFYDKFEGFTIKKRSKGTIWIEEEDPGDKYMQDDLKETKEGENYGKALLKEDHGILIDDAKDDSALNGNHKGIASKDLNGSITLENERNDVICPAPVTHCQLIMDCKSRNELNKIVKTEILEDDTGNCGLSDNRMSGTLSQGSKTPVKIVETVKCETQSQKDPSDPVKVSTDRQDNRPDDIVCNGHSEDNEKKESNVVEYVKKERGTERTKYLKPSRRGGRSLRGGRHRLSVEERLIEDNRAYYKVEVLGSKLRSSAAPAGNNVQNSPLKDVGNGDIKKEVPSSEKPVVVRFKRVRKSELSLLSDEAESFMFGETKREELSEMSETSDGEQSSVLPRDTESSEYNKTAVDSIVFSSSLNSTSSPVKHDILEDDSQDSINTARTKKRRLTQAEALIKDNADYYKFETPGSRLRYQAPLTGIKDAAVDCEYMDKLIGFDEKPQEAPIVDKVYPSKPSPEVEKMQYSFEAVPKSEPWYQTYQRQDEGAEFWHYFSEGDMRKPFLLPYEIENFHEILPRCHGNRSADSKRKSRGKSTGSIGRSPRKSPRCHASTLAIMSTIVRKREQQQQTSNLSGVEEYRPMSRSQNDALKLVVRTKQEPKSSDIDEELKQMARTIDEMLSTKGMADLDDSFELDTVQSVELNFDASCIPKGPPANLLELLDNCHEIGNCLENSSCASSECGEGSTESPLKRRKKRKNRTGWPGIKMRKKLQQKPLLYTECEQQQQDRLPTEKTVPGTIDSASMDIATGTAATSIATTSTCVSVVQQNHELLTQTRTVSDNITGGGGGGRLSNEIVEDIERLSGDHPKILGSEKDRDCEGLAAGVRSSNASLKVCHDLNPKREITVDGHLLEDRGDRCVESIVGANETCEQEERDFLEVDEVSENDPRNDENHQVLFRKDGSVVMTERQYIAKQPVVKKRQRVNTSSELCEQRTEIENHEILCRKDCVDSAIISRKHNANSISRRRQQGSHSDNAESEFERHADVYRRKKIASRRRINSRKRQRKSSIEVETVFENENYEKDSYLTIVCKKQPHQNVKSVKGRSETMSSDMQDSELECALSERVSPTIISPSDLEQRRSSIEFQPVVRMMKIDDQVDMDHSILSVTVASNRRLRSSSSPRSSSQPPKKRLKTTATRGQFGRWLKNS